MSVPHRIGHIYQDALENYIICILEKAGNIQALSTGKHSLKAGDTVPVLNFKHNKPEIYGTNETRKVVNVLEQDLRLVGRAHPARDTADVTGYLNGQNIEIHFADDFTEYFNPISPSLNMFFYDRSNRGAARMLVNKRVIQKIMGENHLGRTVYLDAFEKSSEAEDRLLNDSVFPYDLVIINSASFDCYSVLETAQLGLEVHGFDNSRIIHVGYATAPDGVKSCLIKSGNGHLTSVEAQKLVGCIDELLE